MLSRQKLFWLYGPYAGEESDPAFLQAVREDCAYHIRRCPEYRAIAQQLDFSPGQLRAISDLARIPALPTLFYKRHALFSMPPWRMAMRVTSSGTSGSFSQIGFDWGCILAEIPMVLRLGWKHSLISLKPAHCVVLGYKPNPSNKTGVTRTMFSLTHFAPPLSRTYALQYRDGAYEADIDGIVQKLNSLSRAPFPTRIIGFPSYLWFGLRRMEELGLSARLPKSSKILLAGGWKQHYAQEVDKSLLYALADRVLGVPQHQIHEFFGAVEHPVFINACKNHHFPVPVSSRVLIRDVNTLEPLPMGQTGLLNLISPLIQATPATSVITDDLAYLTPGETCGCGIQTPCLTILGRAGLNDITTCAAGAAELLGKGEAP